MIATLVGEYVIDHEIGRGAFGVVYLGHHKSDEKDRVAIKVLEKNGHIEQQMAEPEMLSRLKHPNIVRLREYFIQRDQLIIVLDYISGGDLKSALDSGRIFSQNEVRELLRSMASALAFAHDCNIVHRDIKMANIMLEESDGQIRFILTDFGIGRMAEGVQDRPNTGGTYLFMAPEQFRGRPVPQSDLWAVGVVAYQLLSGKMPFKGETLNELSRSILYSNPNAPSVAASKQIDEKLDLLVVQLLEKSLNERVSSAKELLRLLESSSNRRFGASTSVFQGMVGAKSVRLSVASGMDNLIKRLRMNQRVAMALALLFGIGIVFSSGVLRGAMMTTGIALFYVSQTRGGPHSRRWVIASGIVLATTWFSFAESTVKKIDKKVGAQQSGPISYDFSATAEARIDKQEEVVAENEPDEPKVKVQSENGVLSVLGRLSYPFFAFAIASHRRISRRLGNCSLMIENPHTDPRYLEKMQKIVADRPNDLLFRLKYVEAMLAQGLMEDVIVECQLILEIDPYNFNANLLLANALVEMGLFEDAATVCREYLDVSGYCFEFQMLLDRCRSQGVGQ